MEDEDEKFERYMESAKHLSKEGSIESLQKACRLYEKALRIKPNDGRIQRRLQKIKDYLKENEDPAELSRNGSGKNNSMDGGEDMVHVGGGFYLYKELYDKLYLHQRDGIVFLHSLYKKGRGGVLGDDMGMGKTIQIVSYLAGMFDSGKIRTVLIIMPLALIINWSNEFEKWAPGINVVDYHSQSKTERAKILKKIQRNGGVCLTSYGVVQKNSELLSQYDHRDFTWDYVILDEGHKVKNPDNKSTKAAHSIAARNRIVISGTPLMNNLMELWAVFDWTHEGQLLGKMSTFRMEYNTPITRSRQKDATAGEQKIGALLLDNLRKKIAPYFLRRVKGDVRMIESRGSGSAPLMPDLPRKNDLICWVYLSPIQQQIYEMFKSSDGVKELLNTSKSPLTALVVLKKICDHARLFTNRQCMELGLNFKENVDVDALDEAVGNKNFNVDHVDDRDLIAESGKMRFLVGLLDHLKETGHRTLVFSLSRHVLDIIQKVMRNKDHKLVRLDGQIKKEERQEIIDKFNKDPSITLFLLTTQVGGVGLTLTAADRVVVFDPSWNPATDSQAVDRVHRIGQTRKVVVYRLITCGTVEEKIYRRQIFKDTINRLITGDSKNPYRYFSQQELAELFELGDLKFSATQAQLEQMYYGKRITDRQLDEHLAFIHSLEMFGISDHDLMFATDVNDDNVYDEESENFARNRVCKAESLLNAECDENIAHVQQGGRYLGGLEMTAAVKAKQRASVLPAAAGSAASAAAAGGSSSAWNESSMSSVAWPASVSARPAGLSVPSTAVRPMASSTLARPWERQEEEMERRAAMQALYDTDDSRDSMASQRPLHIVAGNKAPPREVNEDLDSSLRNMSIMDSRSSSALDKNNGASTSSSHSLTFSSSSDDTLFNALVPSGNNEPFLGAAFLENGNKTREGFMSSISNEFIDNTPALSKKDESCFGAAAHKNDNKTRTVRADLTQNNVDDAFVNKTAFTHHDSDESVNSRSPLTCADDTFVDRTLEDVNGRAMAQSDADESIIVAPKKKSRAVIISDDEEDEIVNGSHMNSTSVNDKTSSDAVMVEEATKETMRDLFATMDNGTTSSKESSVDSSEVKQTSSRNVNDIKGANNSTNAKDTASRNCLDLEVDKNSENVEETSAKNFKHFEGAKDSMNTNGTSTRNVKDLSGASDSRAKNELDKSTTECRKEISANVNLLNVSSNSTSSNNIFAINKSANNVSLNNVSARNSSINQSVNQSGVPQGSEMELNFENLSDDDVLIEPDAVDNELMESENNGNEANESENGSDIEQSSENEPDNNDNESGRPDIGEYDVEHSSSNDAGSDDDGTGSSDSDEGLTQDEICRYQTALKSAKEFVAAKDFIKALEQLKICQSISEDEEKVNEYYIKVSRKAAEQAKALNTLH